MSDTVSSVKPAWVLALDQLDHYGIVRSLMAGREDQSRGATAATGDVVSLGARQDGLERDAARAASAFAGNAGFENVLSSSLSFERYTALRTGGVDAKAAMRNAEAAVRDGIITLATRLYITDPDGGPVDSVTTANGLRVDVTDVIHTAKGQPTASITVTRTDGRSVSFDAGDNVRINERQDGSLAVAVAGSGELRVYAADGTMTTEQLEQDDLQGTDGDDVFLLLRSGGIDAGAGDDTILIMGGAVSVNAGDGNDAVIFSKSVISHSAGATIIGGGGNDTVSGNYAVSHAFVDLGDGDNKVVLDSFHDGSIVAGDGDNKVVLHSFHDGSIVAGDGKNDINVRSMWNSGLTLGNGDNDMTISSTHASSVTAGDGDNTFRWSVLDGGTYAFGNGDNTFVGSMMMDGARLSAGDGDNSFSLGDVFGGTPVITMGDGDNTVNFGKWCKVNFVTGTGKIFGANRWSDTKNIDTLARSRQAQAGMEAHNRFMEEWQQRLFG
jgi:hypothetical protein